ncbi:sensor protein RstB [Variibacter gotjawalensis]|uniref:histidine kinase n=1 Tax=Variibacter gotjawalensis TaxID=1333996 RepID=A0A0S3PYP2_9BRAD|nr:HAMP domain-containing sensor histidine kinase [Variibacter gotjawalensis]NIK46833.1 signal transduction histidine kinase [Variibacter gotjawalensis]RZS48737.1 signal transduction histidine kinase [Variibacter gotjawalensis]BAT60996.1 sensor protein RstB [Variibacter gotjawalensis]
MLRLYKKIYLTIVVSLIAVVFIASVAWRIGWSNSSFERGVQVMAEFISMSLPSKDAPESEQQEAIRRFADRLDSDLTLYDADGRVIASSGNVIAGPRYGSGWVKDPGGAAWAFRLPDGRAVSVRPPWRHRAPLGGFLIFLGVIALVVGLCAYPVVRGLTRRLERLQVGVETLGAGDLSARVDIKGRDEIARLATSFNRAATRIEELVGAHRLLLANASHELRTPLSRIRLGIELMQKSDDLARRADLQRDVAELDDLIDEILLTSRLDAAPQLQLEEIDLLALAAEEASRYRDCEVSGESVTVNGDARLLRRLVRNLLDNAERYGRPPTVVEVKQVDRNAVLTVSDAGNGIPQTEWERVFAPFHRLDSTSRGAGLGLALVRQIARAHGGDISVVAHPNAASAFRAVLPIL